MTPNARKQQQQQQQQQQPTQLSRKTFEIGAADWIEQRLSAALDGLYQALRSTGDSSSLMLSDDDDTNTDTKDVQSIVLFPMTREYNSALVQLGDNGELQRALRVFGKMRKSVILQQKLQEQQQQQQQTWEQQQQQQSGFYPIVVPAPTLVRYSTLMSRAVKSSKPRVTLRLWNLLLNDPAHIVPDVRAVNILMTAYTKLPDLPAAQKVFSQMQTGTIVMGQQQNNNNNNHNNNTMVVILRPNLVTYNTLLDACHRANDLDDALEVKAQIEEQPLNVQADTLTYTTLIATVARWNSKAAGRNDPSLAFSLLDEMLERKIIPNGKTYSALGKEGGWQREMFSLSFVVVLLSCLYLFLSLFSLYNRLRVQFEWSRARRWWINIYERVFEDDEKRLYPGCHEKKQKGVGVLLFFDADGKLGNKDYLS